MNASEEVSNGFSIEYPNTYVILTGPNEPPASTPQVTYPVRFQDSQKASGPFASREPAQFTIHLYELDEHVVLLDWLRETGLAPAGDATSQGPNAGVEQVRSEGTGEGWRVVLPILVAPRESYYYATERYVYRLTPLGPYSQEMLDSFRLSSG